MKNLRFDTLQQAAIGIQKACDSTAMPDLHLMPFSRFSAEDSSLWWLCPVKARKAFNQGKFIFGMPSRFGFDSGIASGLHVERGLKQTLDSTDWKLGADWQWHKFVNDMHVAVPKAVTQMSAILGEPIDVFVFASTDGPQNIDRVHFTSTGITLSIEQSELKLNALKETPACRSWSELSRNLEFLPSSADWYWIDMYIVTRFTLDSSGADDMDVCVGMLEGCQRWLGTS
jgi:hypothetical protein